MGFPIRRSLDQSSFAAPQGISQRTTSFIASQRQGIHQMLLRHLIALMIHVRLPFQEHERSAPSAGSRRSERPVFGSLRRRLLAKTHPAQQPKRPSLARRDRSQQTECAPLHDVKHPQAATRHTHEFTNPTPDPRAHKGPPIPRRSPDGGARRDRTDDLMLAKHALYQLSYGPIGAALR